MTKVQEQLEKHLSQYNDSGYISDVIEQMMVKLILKVTSNPDPDIDKNDRITVPEELAKYFITQIQGLFFDIDWSLTTNPRIKLLNLDNIPHFFFIWESLEDNLTYLIEILHYGTGSVFHYASKKEGVHKEVLDSLKSIIDTQAIVTLLLHRYIYMKAEIDGLEQGIVSKIKPQKIVEIIRDFDSFATKVDNQKNTAKD